jgi:hypothetical protein
MNKAATPETALTPGHEPWWRIGGLQRNTNRVQSQESGEVLQRVDLGARADAFVAGVDEDREYRAVLLLPAALLQLQADNVMVMLGVGGIINTGVDPID